MLKYRYDTETGRKHHSFRNLTYCVIYITIVDVSPPTNEHSWLLFLFSLPTRQASLRVEVWRRLQRIGAIALPASGYVLPDEPQCRESFEWLAALIRNRGGKASVVEALRFDLLAGSDLQALFQKARAKDYAQVLRELEHGKTKKSVPQAGWLRKIQKRFQDISAVDYFQNPLRARVEEQLRRAERRLVGEEDKSMAQKSGKSFKGKVWVTRPRPGIDRVSSAWLIRKYVDPRARFKFANDPRFVPGAVPFDMYQPGGFSHRGDDCTFETLMKEFDIRDARAKTVAKIIHDADIKNDKFNRPEGAGIDKVLKGWAQEGLSDRELLKRGMSLVDGLYRSLS